MVTPYRLEVELAEWLPGSIAGLSDDLAGFVGKLYNRLPSDWDYVSAAMQGNVLILHLTGPDGMTALEVRESIAPIIIGLILGILFIIGLVIVTWHLIDETTQRQEQGQQNIIDSCEWALQNGYYTPEEYTKCVTASAPKDWMVNLSTYVGAALLIVGGGWLILQYSRKGGNNEK